MDGALDEAAGWWERLVRRVSWRPGADGAPFDVDVRVLDLLVELEDGGAMRRAWGARCTVSPLIWVGEQRMTDHSEALTGENLGNAKRIAS